MNTIVNNIYGNFKTYIIRECGSNLNLIQKTFIEAIHYSKTARSQMPLHIFELINSETGMLVGMAIFGRPIGKNVMSLHGKRTIELRRFVCLDGTIKNTESFFLSRCLRWLKRHTFFDKVISYSDPNYGHSGIIYQASNFKYLGRSREVNPRVFIHKRKKIHLRQVYQKHNGKYVKSSILYQKLIKEGKIKIRKQLNKHVYMYELRK